MNNSQSLDIFPEEADINYNMDTECYNTLVCSTKKSLQFGHHSEINKETFFSFFSTLLENCRTCISQSFELINNMLANASINVEQIVEYITDSVSLLQMLSDSIKTAVDLVSLSCFNMKTFPISTGLIIKIVFIHCKQSDSIYGAYLSNVEKHLKDLFRTCHELQLTYLMVMEKHFVFNLSEKDQLNVLDAALQINLEIGKIVENLDVKTMAEQWKAYMAICEKYSHDLKESLTYKNSTEVLCEIIEDNINTASEHNQEDKVITRAVKVSGFMIKILLKIISIFKDSILKDQDIILNLLIFLYVKSYPYNEFEKCTQFTNLMQTNVLCAIEMLLRELLLDQIFVNCLLNYEINITRKEDKLLGYILVLVSIMKAMMRSDSDTFVISKQNIICCLYNCLPHCHICFNAGLKFNIESKHYLTEGFYEYVLKHMVAFAMTLTVEEYCMLERYMIESLLGTDYITALFSSNLWVLLARLMNSQLVVTQLISLCAIYRKSESNELFKFSLQKVHLSRTINRLFTNLNVADKIKVYDEFSYCRSSENKSILCLLNVSFLSDRKRIPTEEKIYQKFRKLISNFVDIEEMNALIDHMEMIASCSFKYGNDLIELLIKGWTKVCFANSSSSVLIQRDLDRRTLWLFRYIRALVSLTSSRINDFCERDVNIVKALHTLLHMVKSRNTEVNLIINDFLFKIIKNLFPLIKTYVYNDKNNTVNIIVEIIKHLFEGTDNNIVKYQLLCTLKKNKRNKNIDKIITSNFSDNDRLKQLWESNIKVDFSGDSNECLEKLIKVSDYAYEHKCIESKEIKSKDDATNVNNNNMKRCSNNFDFVDDIDAIFENESESETRACKKVKFNNNDCNEIIDVIITKLENEASELSSKVKDNHLNAEQKVRMRNLCDKLKKYN